MEHHTEAQCGPYGWCDWHKAEINARAWGDNVLWGIAAGEVDPWMDLYAYQCAREAGRWANKAIDARER